MTVLAEIVSVFVVVAMVIVVVTVLVISMVIVVRAVIIAIRNQPAGKGEGGRASTAGPW